MEKKVKTAFLGTPHFALIILDHLLKWEKGEVVCVVTQPDRPKGRGKKLHHPPVKTEALKHGLKVIQPEDVNDDSIVEFFERLKPDVLVVAAFGQILSSKLLNIPKYGAINVHASLLPKYRGASPIQWAVLKGEKITGVTIMKMDEGLDTGPILAQKVVPIGFEDDASKLHDKLAVIGGELLISTLERLINGLIIPVPQDSKVASYAPLLKKEDGLINWDRSATEVHNHIRAMSPWPGAFFYWTRPKDGKNLMLKIFPGTIHFEDNKHFSPGTIIEEKGVLKIACKDFFYIPSKIQPQSSKPLNPEAFCCGYLR